MPTDMSRSNSREQKKVANELEEARNIYVKANEHYERGELKPALEGYRDALAIFERLDPDSLNTATIYNNIALVLRQQGDLVGALREYRRALTIKEREAPDSLTVAATYNNIGAVLKQQGDLEGAVREYLRALTIVEREAPDSLTVAVSYSCIGAVLHDRGDLEGALREYRRALTIREREAPDSLTVATSYNNIGCVLYAQGDLEGALREYRRALAIREREAPDSLDVATTYNNIASVLDNQGDLEGALREYRRALTIEEREAPDSLTVATSYNNIGLVLNQQGDLEGALREYRRALVIGEREAPDSLTVATWYHNIGGVLKQQGDLEGALREHRRALTIEERKAPDSPALAQSLISIGSLLKDEGDLDDALPYFERSHEILLRPQISLSPRHPTLISCKYELGDLLLKCRNDYEKGLQLADEIIEALPEYKWAYTLKARAQLGLGVIQAAIDTYDVVISLAPNYADAHAGRLQALFELEESQRDEREKTINRLRDAFELAKGVDPKAHEEVDQKIEKLFREESRKDVLRDTPEVELPEPNIKTHEELLKIVMQLQEKVNGIEGRVDEHDVKIDELSQKVHETWVRLEDRKENNDELRRRINKFAEGPNQKDYLESILSEISVLVTVAEAVSSGMIEWRAEMPEVVSYACMVATLISLAPLPGSGLLAKGIKLPLTSYVQLQQKLQFETLTKLSSVSHFNELILLIALEWCDRFESHIKDLPKWNSDLGQELRKDLYRTWCNICARVKSGSYNVQERVCGACDAVLKDVGLNLNSGTRSKKAGSTVGPEIREDAKDIWLKGKLFLFGGENIGLASLQRRLVAGKPLSPATVLGKVHSREILLRLLQEETFEQMKYPQPLDDGRGDALGAFEVFKKLHPMQGQASSGEDGAEGGLPHATDLTEQQEDQLIGLADDKDVQEVQQKAAEALSDTGVAMESCNKCCTLM